MRRKRGTWSSRPLKTLNSDYSETTFSHGWHAEPTPDSGANAPSAKKQSGIRRCASGDSGPPDLHDWVPPGHLVHFLIDPIESIVTTSVQVTIAAPAISNIRPPRFGPSSSIPTAPELFPVPRSKLPPTVMSPCAASAPTPTPNPAGSSAGISPTGW